MSKYYTKPPLVKGSEKKEEPKWIVKDQNWYARAACQGSSVVDLFSIVNEPSARSAERELRARNICTRSCQVREDCVIDAWKHGDTGQIRGGCRFVAGTGKSECVLCGLPAAKPGRLCFYCVHKRYCVTCGSPYAAASSDDEDGLCPTCDPEQNKSRVKKAKLRTKKVAA